MEEHIGIIFDCDGTLLDSMGVWRAMEDELARQSGVELTKAHRNMLISFTIPESAAFFHQNFGLGETVEQVIAMMDNFILNYYRTSVKARPGALEFVRRLAQRGVALGVASSSSSIYLQTGLRNTGFLTYISTVVSVDDVGSSKRSPTVYHRARALMGTSLESTWGFEDSAYALRTLRHAGYRTVGVYDCDDSGTREQLALLADQTIDSFEELDGSTFGANNE